MVVTEHFDQAKLEHKSLQINSPILKEILRRIIGDYPGESYGTKDIHLNLPAKSLFHYADELKAELNTPEEKNAHLGRTDKIVPGGRLMSQETTESTVKRRHLDCLVSWIEDEFKDEFRAADNMIPAGIITYDLLWTIFRPGILVFTIINDEPQILQLTSTYYSPEGLFNPASFELWGWHVDLKGRSFGRRDISLSIKKFKNTQRIDQLSTVPLDLHPEKNLKRQQAEERGKRFHDLCGQHHCTYDAVALGVGNEGRCHIVGRVMIDNVTFSRSKPDENTRVASDDPAFWKCSLSDRYLLSPSRVAGFSLREKRWCMFAVDKLCPVQYNEAVFGKLVLPDKQKSLVRAMIENHVGEESQFDDIISGKGKGLIALLHGPPGVGKTLMVEAISEHTRRPVYSVSAGDLGITPPEVDSNLTKIFDLVSTWKAVLLLDEADVFLEQRALQDLTRNALVTIFLRRLEYFPGIMFLTTNRITTFDEAFHSRIHLAIKFNELDFQSRLTIWKNFLSDITSSTSVSIKPHEYNNLAERRFNGRQIKNSVRTAQIMAASERKDLDLNHLLAVIDSQESFHGDVLPVPRSTHAFKHEKHIILGLFICVFLHFVISVSIH